MGVKQKIPLQKFNIIEASSKNSVDVFRKSSPRKNSKSEHQHTTKIDHQRFLIRVLSWFP